MIQKQPVSINFASGLNTKTDPWQVPPGEFLTLENSVFTKAGLLQKRNGYGALAALPNSSSVLLTTLNDNLTAIGSSVSALAAGQWASKGTIQPLSLSTTPLVRNAVNQTQCDSAISANGLICTVFTETNSGSSTYKYCIADSVTGQNVISPAAIPVASGTVTGSPRVFLLEPYFVIAFTNVITAVSHLQYIAISSLNPATATSNQDLATSYIPASTLSWGGVVANGNLYVAYNTTSGGQAVKVTYLSTAAAALGQTPATPVTFAGAIATMMSLCVDTTNAQAPVIYVSYYDSAGSTAKTLALDLSLTTLMSVTSVLTSGTVLNLASAAQSGVCRLYYEVSNNYSYDSGVASHYVAARTITLPATVTTGTVSPAAGSAASGTVIARSVGLASKAFIANGNQYFLGVYQSPYQSTYFLIQGSSSVAGSPVVVAKLAYQNAGGYVTLGLPSVSVSGLSASFPYLVKDFIAAQSSAGAAPVASQVLGVYSQTGINLANVTFSTTPEVSEIASSLHLSGGFLWQYDGYLPVENNFFLYPDSVEISTATTGGLITDQQYFYAATYEWQDNQGNAHRSATSIPVAVTTAGGNTSSNTVNVPYLRLTYKIANPAKIVIYRWSVAQPVFYRVTSLTAVQTNSTTSDSLAFVDTLADSAILGNDILYTTGGTAENINAPAFDSVFLFDDRLWGITSEDKNLMWFSKQVIEATPVEMSDLLTYYSAPSAGAQGPTGPLKCGAAMDDKLILFKASAMSYINGSGPDNTGNNSQYSPSPVFITSTVGCSNQKSIIFQPQGLMFEFQSESGNQIWLLGRDLSTKYIGAAVEAYTQNATIESAVNIPGTNQVRFTLSSGVTLMYDYFYNQWGTFANISATSACLYRGLHTYLSGANVYQETPGLYLDGSRPVLMSFKSGWFNLAGLQGYQRAYFFYVLGKYYSPHKMFFEIAYDYADAPMQSVLISPTNFSGTYGGTGSDSQSPYGQQTQYGGATNVEQWRIFLKQQRCQAMQIAFSEIFDPSFGAAAGAGLTMSGINLVVGVKSGFVPLPNAQSAGTS